MSYYPIFLALDDRFCVVVGGGEVAERKIEGLLGSGARVFVIAPQATPRITDLAAAGRLRLERRAYAAGDLAGAFLAIAATDDRLLQEQIAAEARAERILLNVVDARDLCDFIAPAILERGDLQIAVSTAGAAPALAARLRDRLAESIGEEYGVAVALLRRLRERLHSTVADSEERRRILLALAAADLPESIRRGDRCGVDRLLRSASGGRCGLDDLTATEDPTAWVWRP